MKCVKFQLELVSLTNIALGTDRGSQVSLRRVFGYLPPAVHVTTQYFAHETLSRWSVVVYTLQQVQSELRSSN